MFAGTIQRNPRGIKTDRMFAVRIMEHLVVPTFVIDPNHKVLIWNRACERLTGVSAKEVIGTRDHWRGFYEAERPCIADIVARGDWASNIDIYVALSLHEHGRQGLAAENWCVLPKDGARRYLAFDAGPIFSEEGELIAVVETVRDMTAQHEAQTALEALASLDGLTGISNRRNFDGHLRREWLRAARDNETISLLMIDIDHFKQFNDVAGHQKGDERLQQIARAISDQLLRATDLAARYGGEEFAVILPGANLAGALAVADRILTSVAALALPHPASPLGTCLTVSIGVAGSDFAKCAIESELISAADAALYRAKKAGRNCVSI